MLLVCLGRWSNVCTAMMAMMLNTPCVELVHGERGCVGCVCVCVPFVVVHRVTVMMMCLSRLRSHSIVCVHFEVFRL